MTVDSASIREERSGEETGIRNVHLSAFPTDMEGRLVEALRRAACLSISLVALVRDEIVGHVAFSPVTIGKAISGLGLAPVAVVPSFQKRGIGTALIREGLAACRQCATGFVVVLGEPSYYGRFGFLPASRWKLSDEYGGGKAFQVIELQPGTIPKEGGLVKYSSPFSVFDLK